MVTVPSLVTLRTNSQFKRPVEHRDRGVKSRDLHNSKVGPCEKKDEIFFTGFKKVLMTFFRMVVTACLRLSIRHRLLKCWQRSTKQNIILMRS